MYGVVDRSIKTLFLRRFREWHLNCPESLVCSWAELAPVARADCISDPKGMAENSFPTPKSRGILFREAVSAVRVVLSSQWTAKYLFFPLQPKAKSGIWKTILKSGKTLGFWGFKIPKLKKKKKKLKKVILQLHSAMKHCTITVSHPSKRWGLTQCGG